MCVMKTTKLDVVIGFYVVMALITHLLQIWNCYATCKCCRKRMYYKDAIAPSGIGPPQTPHPTAYNS